jgi:hypothetical protein
MDAKKTSSKKPSKSSFIRTQPAALSAAEVVEKGNAAGIKFTTQLVYNVRGGSKKKPTKAPASAKKGTAKKTPKAAPKKPQQRLGLPDVPREEPARQAPEHRG